MNTLHRDRLLQAKDRDIRSVAQSFGFRLANNGKTAFCIDHSRGKSPSITFGRHRRSFRCWNCGAHGDSIDFVQWRLDCSWSEAVEYLLGDLPEPDETWEPPSEIPEVPYSDRVKAASAFHASAASVSSSPDAIDFLEGRGITAETIARFDLRVLTNDRGVPDQSAQRAAVAVVNAAGSDIASSLGLAGIPSRGEPYFPRTGHWLVIPYRDLRGDVGHLQFRRILRSGEDLGPKDAKYVHMRGTVPFGFNLPALRSAPQGIWLVEGAMDAMRLDSADMAAVGIPGARWLDAESAGRIVKHAGNKPLCVGFDADHYRKRKAGSGEELFSPGLDGMKEAAQLLAEAGATNIHTVDWPADFIEREDANDWCDWLAESEDLPATLRFVPEHRETRPGEPVPNMHLRDLGAEKALLRSLLDQPDLMCDFASELGPLSFSEDAHAGIYYAIAREWEDNATVDPVLVRSRLRGEFLKAFDALPPGPQKNPRLYFTQVVEMTGRRRLNERLGHASRVLAAGGGWEQAQRALEPPKRLADNLSRLDQVEAVARYRAEFGLGRERVVSTGLPDLDDALGGGFRFGETSGMLGKPGSGKTMVAFSGFAVDAARRGVPTLRISLEMSAEQVLQRDISRLASIPYRHLLDEKLNRDERIEWDRALSLLESLPLWFVGGSMTIDKIRDEIRRYVADRGVRFVVVDHFHCVGRTRGRERDQEHYQHLGAMTKEIRLEFPDVAILWLGHMNKDSSRRGKSPPPEQGDWRFGTTGFLQDVRVLIGIHRLPPSTFVGSAQRAEIHCLKTTFGRAGDIVSVGFEGRYQRVVGLQRADTWGE